ncbi:TolC family protein [Algivirga pacifica]|uniref:TolC family protein n=2 Tax=Algivirga pacifica TaxID=1162670 RepID=A0ABP9DG15_9BACT
MLFITGAAWAQQQLNLEQAIALAQEQSQDAIDARFMYQSEAWEYEKYQLTFLPTANLNFTPVRYNRSLQQTTLPSFGELGGGVTFFEQENISTSVGVDIAQQIAPLNAELSLNTSFARWNDLERNNLIYYNTPVNLRYSQKLFQFNAYRWDRKLKPLQYRRASKALVEQLETVAVNVANSYFDVVSAQIELERATEQLANADTLFRVEQQRMRLGTSQPEKVRSFEIDMINAELSQVEAEAKLAEVSMNFKEMLQLDLDQSVKLMVPEELPVKQIDAQMAVELFERNSPEVLRLEEDALNASIEAAQAKARTGVNGEANINVGLSEADPELTNIYRDLQNQQGVTVSFSMPILDWQRAKKDYRLAKVKEETTQSRSARRKKQLALDVRRQVDQFNIQVRRLEIAKKQMQLADLNYEYTMKRYMMGSITDVLQVKNASSEQQRSWSQYINVLRSYWSQYYSLRQQTLYDFDKGEGIQYIVN